MESNDGLERMGLCLTELEKRPEDGELVAEIFRAVHTIKGTTGFLGFRRLGMLAHTGEGLLAALRDRKVTVTSELISGLLALVDGLGTILRLIECTGIEGDRWTDDDTRLIELHPADWIVDPIEDGRGRVHNSSNGHLQTRWSRGSGRAERSAGPNGFCWDSFVESEQNSANRRRSIEPDDKPGGRACANAQPDSAVFPRHG